MKIENDSLDKLEKVFLWIALALVVMTFTDNRNRIVELEKKIEIIEKEKR